MGRVGEVGLGPRGEAYDEGRGVVLPIFFTRPARRAAPWRSQVLSRWRGGYSRYPPGCHAEKTMDERPMMGHLKCPWRWMTFGVAGALLATGVFAQGEAWTSRDGYGLWIAPTLRLEHFDLPDGDAISTFAPEHGAGWLQFRCRAGAEPANVYIDLPDIPDSEPPPHWLGDLPAFVAALSGGEHDTWEVTIDVEGLRGAGFVRRARVRVWTEPSAASLEVHPHEPTAFAAAVLGAAGSGAANRITVTAPEIRIALTVHWSQVGRSAARAMLARCIP